MGKICKTIQIIKNSYKMNREYVATDIVTIWYHSVG